MNNTEQNKNSEANTFINNNPSRYNAKYSNPTSSTVTQSLQNASNNYAVSTKTSGNSNEIRSKIFEHSEIKPKTSYNLPSYPEMAPVNDTKGFEGNLYAKLKK